MIKKSALVTFLILFGLTVTCLYVLLLSQDGLRLSIRAAERFLPGKFSVDSVQGRLSNSFTLQGFHYSDGGNVISIDRFSFSWNPVSLLHKELDIRLFEVKGANLSFPTGDPDDSISDEGITFPSFSLPLSVKIKHGFVESLVVKTSDDTPPFQLKTILVENLLGKESLIQIGNCEVASDSYRIVAHGQVQTGDVYATTLTIDYSVNNEGMPSLTGNGVLSGSVKELAYEAHFLSPFIGSVQGVVNDLSGDLSWKASVLADQINLSTLNKDWPEVMFAEFQTSGEGTLSSYSLQAETNAAYDSFQDIRVSLHINSSGYGLRSGEHSLEGLEYEAHFLSPFIGSVQGVVNDLSGDLSWKASVLANQINLSALNKDWPEVMFTELQTSGEGTLSVYSVQAAAHVSYDSFQDLTVSANINGNDSGLEIADARINHRETDLTCKGELAWKDILTWKVNLTGSQINPAVYDSRWPGRLKLEAFTSGQLSNGEVKAVVDLVKLEGDLREFPLMAKGKIEVNGNDFTIDAFTVQSADSFLQASGQVADSVNLDFRLEAFDLNTLWPGLSGSMETAGQINGSRQHPRFQFDMSGDKIALENTKVTDLTASGSGELTPEGSIDVSFSATEVTVAEILLDTVAAEIKGTLQDHVFEARVNAPVASAIANFQGGYADNMWKGYVSKGEIKSDRAGSWQVQDTVSIALSADNAEIGKFCLTGSQDSLVCIDGNYNKAGDWSGHAEITALPVGLFKNMQSISRKVGGFLFGTATVNGKGDEITEANLDLSADNIIVEVDFSDDYSREIIWQENTIHAAFNGNSVDVKINSILTDGSSLTAEALLNDITLLPFSIEKAGVQGNVHLNVLDLQPLSAISLPTIDPYGTLKGDLEFSGKLLHPDFLGHVQLDNEKIILPEQGITIKDVLMSVDGKDNRLHLLVTATSGGGTIHGESFYSLVKQEENPSVEVNITGENFEIINLHEARIKVSPDLKVMISKQQGEVDGDILITEANITLQNMSGVVSSSKDIVFVNEGEVNKEASWPFYTNLTIKAGENARVSAYGLRGRVDGQLQLVDQPEKPTIGEGDLEVKEGTFSIYGRQLNIVRGRLLYSGSPLDNPGIELRAENTTGKVTTGVEVSGFLREPDISFYSTPIMPESEIIQRLLMNASLVGSSEDKGFVGSVASDTGLDTISSAVQSIKEGFKVDDVKIETGEDVDDISLVIGTWLRPDLYISYGKNLLNESGSFRTRYLLGYGFSMETESGATDNGFDLMYEIDK